MWEWFNPLVQTRCRCVWGKECVVGSKALLFALCFWRFAVLWTWGWESILACFSCCIELKGETGCREYRLQIKCSGNAAFFEGQRNAEFKLNALRYVNATPRMLELRVRAAGGKPVSASHFGWNICCSTAIAQPQLFQWWADQYPITGCNSCCRKCTVDFNAWSMHAVLIL